MSANERHSGGPPAVVASDAPGAADSGAADSGAMDSAAGWDPAGAAVVPPPLHAPMAKIATSPSAARRVRELMLT